jgi:hypothetical protein
MHRSGLNVSLRLLLNACAGAALLSTPGCAKDAGSDAEDESTGADSSCQGGWEPSVDVELMSTGPIVSLTRTGSVVFALTPDGLLNRIDQSGEVTSETIPATGLRDWVELAAFGDQLAVGDGGQILRFVSDSSEWTVIDAGITDDLLDVIAADDSGTSALAITSNAVHRSTDQGATWTELVAPEGGWTGLRKLFRVADQIWLLGAGGQVWTTSDPSGSWQAVDIGTSEDLLDGFQSNCQQCVVIASASTLYMREYETWEPVPAPEGEVFIAVGDGFAVTDRAVYSAYAYSLQKVADLDFTPSGVVGSPESLYVSGTGGELMYTWQIFCLGRPWLIDGTPRTAALQGRATADRWARDGLYEHASVASFARFVSELLTLGAPPALVQAAQAAILDELEHARLCFELAAREHGLVRPGPLPLDPHTTARAGDPLALALAVFDEGCIGESIAAVEAGITAAESEDPEVRRALERIAIDERQHAALAWRTLRWLVDSFGEPVRAALRDRLLELGGVGNEVYARTVVEIVRPLARALLASPAPSCATIKASA